MDYFSAFYSIYPRKAARLVAEKAANRIKEEEWLIIMPALQKHITYWKQQGTAKNFIPLPASWLNGRRWEDELELDAEVQTESSAYTFLKAVRNKNNLTLPDLPHDIKQAFFRMGISWNKLQQMEESDIETRFSAAYNNISPILEIDEKLKQVDFKSRAAGE